jgi:ABC-2 type transport system ATP-binding protein
MAAIETHALRKEYGDLTALDDLDLTVEEGEVFGFLGPNGAGKTTTIDLLLDFIRPTSGSATILGHDARTESDAVRERIGILPDGIDLWGRSTGYRHLEFAIDSTNGDEDPDELLARVGLGQADAERRVADYSKGMLQRLAMAMALAGDPDLLVLDEPSSGLDPNGIRLMQNIVREEAADGTTVFFSSHILGQVAAVCDRVGILEDGQLVTVDTIDGLRETSGVGSRLVLTADDVPTAALAGIDGVTDVTTRDGEVVVTYADDSAKADIVHRAVEGGATVRNFRTEEATLDELFAAYTETDVDALGASDRVGTERDATAESAGTAGAGGESQ